MMHETRDEADVSQDMLRVNSARRISICHEAGVDSIDGTSVSRFAVTIGRLDRAVRQGALALIARGVPGPRPV